MTRGYLAFGDGTQKSLTRRHSSAKAYCSELSRMSAARDVGLLLGVFRAPKVYVAKSQELSIEIELIPGFTPLAVALMQSASPDVILGVAMKALAAIHAAQYEAPSGREPLYHGDYDVLNVGLDADGRIAVIDWDAAPGLSRSGLSMQERDIGLFQFSLVNMAVRGRKTLAWIEGALECALAEYCAATGTDTQSARSAGETVFSELSQWRNVPGRYFPVRCFRWALRNAGNQVHANLSRRALRQGLEN